MEARSLTSLNNLAANPPQYPVNPAEERQDPLVLYISRVPGTRDVILSPFKPQQKIVSAEDVASCLYYIHLEKPMPGFQSYAQQARDDGFGSSGDEGSMRNIPRKPVPETTNSPPTLSRENLPVPGDDTHGAGRTRGYTVNTTLEMPHHDQGRRSLDGRGFENRADWTPVERPIPAGLSRSQTISRKPVGPRARPNLNRPRIEKPTPLGPEFQTMGEGERVPAQGFDPRKSLQTSRSPSPRKQAGEPAYTNPFTLALIRRDPSTGAQWNVAHVSSYQSETLVQPESEEAGPLFSPVPPVTQSQSNAANPPINIQIETLGYRKFRNMPTRRSFDIGPGDGIPEDSKFPRSDDAVLSRQLLMSYAKTWSTNFKERWNQDSINQQRGEHRRHGSVASVESTGSNSGELSPGPQTSLGSPLPGMRPRGYVFTSPWNGRCEFRTGTTGRNLRCYHILNDDKPAINALMEQQGLPTPPQGLSMPLSELRFNLPTHELFKSSEGREEVKTQIQGHFNKLLQKLDNRGGQSDDDGTVSPFEVNLGKEKAGGGKHGKRAKLGKLIVYPDGLKMLDMVVAANMGIWWGAWERSF